MVIPISKILRGNTALQVGNLTLIWTIPMQPRGCVRKSTIFNGNFKWKHNREQLNFHDILNQIPFSVIFYPEHKEGDLFAPRWLRIGFICRSTLKELSTVKIIHYTMTILWELLSQEWQYSLGKWELMGKSLKVRFTSRNSSKRKAGYEAHWNIANNLWSGSWTWH